MCDPDRILTDEERELVNRAYFDLITSTEYRTSADIDFCLKQRIHTHQSLQIPCFFAALMPYVVIVRKVPSSGNKATPEEVSSYTERLSVQFNGDVRCQKDIVILLSINDTYTYIDPNGKVGIAKTMLDDVRTSLRTRVHTKNLRRSAQNALSTICAINATQQRCRRLRRR